VALNGMVLLNCAGFQATRRLFPAASKKVRLPPTWGMRAGAFVATMQAWLTEQPVANYFDTRSGLPETPLVAVATGGFEVLVNCVLKFN
jgi:hypothetical protein